MDRAQGVGIIGCGSISTTYLSLAELFKDIKIVACADINSDLADKQAGDFGIESRSVEQLLVSKDIDIVVNLTIPSAHFAVSKAALEAGKHVYSEKPFVLDNHEGEVIKDLAADRGLRIGSAPDTFFGGSHQQARALIDDGVLGQITGGTLAVMSRGMEMWHPNPDFFFKPGGGPVLDLGPYYITCVVQLLGPIARVASFGSTPRVRREITSAPRAGEFIDVETPTSVRAILEFHSGATVTFSASWDVHAHGMHHMELYGELGTLTMPDPNFFGGDLKVVVADKNRDSPAINHPFGQQNQQHADGPKANYRAAGLADMAAAIREDRPHRCGPDLAHHVIDVLTSIIKSSSSGKVITIGTTCERPAALDAQQARALLAL